MAGSSPGGRRAAPDQDDQMATVECLKDSWLDSLLHGGTPHLPDALNKVGSQRADSPRPVGRVRTAGSVTFLWFML